ncbi:MAG: hypothetical protein H3C43_09460 [Leptonema sp. (in: Bacteria)]|nr:hypothetical protein [Leptonema sp. (in: bacteria)]
MKSTTKRRLTIGEVFSERRFLLLREFAHKKGLVYLDELKHEVDTLRNVRGIGEKKYETILEKIKNPTAPSRYQTYGYGSSRPVNYNMPINRAFKGSYRVFIEFASKQGYKTLNDLKGITLDQIRSVNWPGNAIYKSFLRKLERYGIHPEDPTVKLDIDKHGMGILTDDVKLNKAYQSAKVANLREFLQLGEEGRLAIKNYGEISEHLLRDLLIDHDMDPTQFEHGNRFPERDLKLKPNEILPRMKALLSQREFMILQNRGIKKQTLEAVGSDLNLTRERIRQIEKKAVLRTNIFLGPIIQQFADKIHEKVLKAGGRDTIKNICRQLSAKEDTVSLIAYLAGYKDLRIDDQFIYIDETRTRSWPHDQTA